MLEGNDLHVDQQGNCIKYQSKFNINALDPHLGDIFSIFVPISYFLKDSKPISEMDVYGSKWYSSSSDIVAMIVHSHLIFQTPNTYHFAQSYFSTITNFEEIMILPDSQFNEKARFLNIPLDLKIKGIIVEIFIDYPLKLYPSVDLNSIISKEKKGEGDYSFRIIHYGIVSAYDNMPNCVNPNEYVRTKAYTTKFVETEDGIILMSFNSNFFNQTISYFSNNSKAFGSFVIFFYDNIDKFQVSFNKSNHDFLTVSKVDKSSDGSESMVLIHEGIKFSDIKAKKNSIKICSAIYNSIKYMNIINTQNNSNSKKK